MADEHDCGGEGLATAMADATTPRRQNGGRSGRPAQKSGARISAHLVERFYHEVWNRADEAVAREILHREFAFRASLGPTRTGPDGFIDYMRAIHAALGDYQCIIEDLVEAERRAAARMTFTGIHRAPFFGVAATGRRITWAGSAFFTTDGRQIAALWVLGDIDAVRRQLGAASDAGFA